MNLESLHYVEVLAQHQSLQKAADALHISKSGLSSAISLFEEELGVKLFIRSSKGTQLTQEGRQLLASISNILRYKNQLEITALQLAQHQSQQKVTIHYMNTFLEPFISTFLDGYSDNYRTVQLDISLHELDSIIERLHKQEIDAGFIAVKQIDDQSLQHLTFTPICDSKLSLFCSPKNELAKLDRPITFDDLKKQRFSLFNDRFHDSIFETLQYQCGPLQLVLRVDDAWAMEETITKLNTVCFGRKLQSELSPSTDFSDCVSIDISHLIDDNFKIGWLTNPNHMLSDKAKLLIEEITASIKKNEG